MNNKGFAITGVLYSVLLIFLVMIVTLLFNLQNRKTILDELKTDTINAVESENNYEYLLEEINKLKSQVGTTDISSIEDGTLSGAINELNSVKANKRQYIGEVIGKESITLDDDVYKVECMIVPFPNAETKTVIPIAIDLGIISYGVASAGTHQISYGANLDYRFLLNVNTTTGNRKISLNTVYWDGVDITETTKLIVLAIN